MRTETKNLLLWFAKKSLTIKYIDQLTKKDLAQFFK
jgi:hypothetical protein